jgi:hypothetical protein
MAITIGASKEKNIKVTPNYFLRDIIFLVVTCIYLLVILFFIKEINLIVASGLLVLYFVYVVTVLIQDKYFCE